MEATEINNKEIEIEIGPSARDTKLKVGGVDMTWAVWRIEIDTSALDDMTHITLYMYKDNKDYVPITIKGHLCVDKHSD